MGSSTRLQNSEQFSGQTLPLPIDQRSRRPDMSSVPRSLLAIPRQPAAIASHIGMIHVFGYTPAEGEQGVPITVRINFHHKSPQPIFIRLVVGGRPVPTTVRELSDRSYGRWQLEAASPPFDRQANASAKVSIVVEALNHENRVLDSVIFGDFKYWESDCDCAPLQRPLKRARGNEEVNANVVVPSSTLPSGPLRKHDFNRLPTPPTNPSDQVAPRSRSRKQSNRRICKPHALVRTRHPNSGDLPADGYAERAALNLITPLKTLCHSWDEHELQVGRRLVRFHRVQEGHRLKVSCEPIQQDHYHESDTVISCIYREEVRGFFVTSVDIIYLLEKLVDADFEVEEKNRIRRNLEGLKPTTVSKHKAGFERFFQRIMDFPDPKPRNIEKDLKVFEWTLLEAALDKIISKYSLYSSNRSSSPRQNHQSLPAEPKAEYIDSKGPILDVSNAHTRASFHQFPPNCVDPSVITKFEPPADDVLFLSPPDTVDTLGYFTADFSHAQESDSNNGSGGWTSEIKGALVIDTGAFDVTPAPFVDDGDAYGMNTYDSLEFQTLREHNMLTSTSDHYLQ